MYDTCPSLVQFHIVEDSDLYKRPGLCFTDPDTRSVIAITNMPYLVHELEPLLARQRLSIEILRLNLESTIRAGQVWKSIASAQGFPKLREIELEEKDEVAARYYMHNSSDEDSNEVSVFDSDSISEDTNVSLDPEEMACLIRLCPSLKVVRLVKFELDDEVFKVLGDLKHLVCLNLLRCKGILPEMVSQFFSDATAIEHFSYPEFRKRLDADGLHVSDILSAISQSPNKTLRELHITSRFSFRKVDLDDFVKSMQNAKLSCITLSYGGLSQDHLQEFLQLATLAVLRLEDVYISDDVDVMKALEYRQEPVCITLKCDIYGKEKRNGIYIKAKDGHVQHYQK